MFCREAGPREYELRMNGRESFDADEISDRYRRDLGASPKTTPEDGFPCFVWMTKPAGGSGPTAVSGHLRRRLARHERPDFQDALGSERRPREARRAAGRPPRQGSARPPRRQAGIGGLGVLRRARSPVPANYSDMG